MAHGEGFYCTDVMCDGDHPLPSMTCDDPPDDGAEHHIEPPC